MAKLVTVTFRNNGGTVAPFRQVQVPEGTLVVNAAKLAGVDIPVFCYHPKMEPVGMCRMCLVEVGRPMIDRTTGEPVREADGSLKIQFNPKLETACTTPVSDGMVVLGMTEKAMQGRKDVIEFLLTSHPLDCPICDKGGECPLQNQTMEFGPGVSRYIYNEKMRLAKHVPLGNLIYLDRERCIQCGRCVRFQELIADDPVIGFFNRGRSLEIVTYSEPGFDSYFSGNTTDICPVGALTTADFHFGARPWELNSAPSICNQCPVGCNIMFNIRRESVSGGKWAIKRVMPRQNEAVNEIWICDKGRFGYHYAEWPQTSNSTANGSSEAPQRLSQPMVRKNGELTPATWDEALNLVAERFKLAGNGLLTLASGRLANEDLFNLQQLTNELGGRAVLYSELGGGDFVSQVGLAPGSNFAAMGKGTVILVVASDLEEEAPIWWLRVREAARRGATLIVANPRTTKLDRIANRVLRYSYGSEVAFMLGLLSALPANKSEAKDLVPEIKVVAQEFASAENAVIFFGSEGTSLESSQALAQVCADLLRNTGHSGATVGRQAVKANNGLVSVWQRANDQGAWEMGFRPVSDMASAMKAASALYMVAVDPVGDDPVYLAEAADQTLFGGNKFIVVQDLALTATAKLADVILPVQAWTEREGSYTSGERRVQRFYPAIPELPGSLADFEVTGKIGQCLGIDLESRLASRVMDRISAHIPVFAGISYHRLAEVHDQWPMVGRSDLYYGGSTYENSQGLGVQLPLTVGEAGSRNPNSQRGSATETKLPTFSAPKIGFMAVPITVLYDHGQTILSATLIQERIPGPFVVLNPEDAARLKIDEGAVVRVTLEGKPTAVVNAHLDSKVPLRTVLVPRSYGLPIAGPTAVDIKSGGTVVP